LLQLLAAPQGSTQKTISSVASYGKARTARLYTANACAAVPSDAEGLFHRSPNRAVELPVAVADNRGRRSVRYQQHLCWLRLKTHIGGVMVSLAIAA
jgi:hypothetical protein